MEVHILTDTDKGHKKRNITEMIDSTDTNLLNSSQSTQRPRITSAKDIRMEKLENSALNAGRWRSHRMMDDYVNLIGDNMVPKVKHGSFGYDSNKAQYPLARTSTLGFLTCPLRRPNILEKWNPYEIALFESSIVLFGKNFHILQKHITSKSVKEIVEFYYFWKKTSHYASWSTMYVADERELQSILERETK